ncbi:hypothetical protein JCM10450v2_001371 [Rhodotorula kratochvilovae]
MPKSQLTESLVRKYLLRIASPEPIRISSDHPLSPTADPDTVTEGPEHTVTDIATDVPPDADARLRRLVQDLHLEPVVRTSGVIAHEGSQMVQEIAQAPPGEQKLFRRIPLGEMRPGWRPCLTTTFFPICWSLVLLFRCSLIVS